MRRLAAIFALALLFVPHVAAVGDTSTGEKLINSSEPKFLRDIGPQMQRSDNQLAALVTVVVVAAVIGRGIKAYGPGGAKKKELGNQD